MVCKGGDSRGMNAWLSVAEPPADSEFLSLLRISEFFLFYIADFWQIFWVISENGSNWSNLRLKMSFFALGRLKNHNVPHLHPNSTMFMPLDRLQLKIYAFSGKFNVCSKRVLLSWIKICRDFTLQTQIFTQKYRSWLRFYSEFLRKKLAAEGSALEPSWKGGVTTRGRLSSKTVIWRCSTLWSTTCTASRYLIWFVVRRISKWYNIPPPGLR